MGLLAPSGTNTITPFGTGTVTMGNGTTLSLSNVSGSLQASPTLSNNFADSSGSGSVTYMNISACNGTSCSKPNQFVLTGQLNYQGTLRVNYGTVASPGNLVLAPSGNNNAITSLYIYGGRLYLENSGSVGNGTIHTNGGELAFSSAFTLPLSTSIVFNINGLNMIDDGGNSVTIQSLISEAGGFTGKFDKEGGGVLTLTNNANSYTGGTRILLGTLSISNIGQINSATGGLVLNGGTLFTTASMTLPGGSSLSISSGGLATTGTLTVSSPIANDGTPGTLRIGSSDVLGASGTVVFQGTNTFSGNIVIGLTTPTNSSTVFNSYPANLSIAGLTNLGSPKSVTLEGNGALLVTGSTTFSSGMGFSLGNNGGTVSAVGSGVLVTIPGVVADVSGASNNTLSLSGGGTVYLSGQSNTFSGAFSVSSGTVLQVASVGSLGNSGSTAPIILNGSTFSVLSQSITANRVLSVTGGNGILNIGSGLSLTFSSPVTVASSANLVLTGGGSFTTFSPSSDIPTVQITNGTFIGNTNSLEHTTSIVFNPSAGQTASLVFNQTTFGTFNGVISGNGSVQVLGSGGLSLGSSNNSYTMGTYVSGLLIVNTDVSSSTTGALGAPTAPLIGMGGTVITTTSFIMNRPITLTTNTDTTFSPNVNTVLDLRGALNGLGNFIKSGSGTIILRAISPDFTGKLYVDSGLLTVSGDISSSVDPIVAYGALLSGTGIIGDSVVYGTIKGGENLLGSPFGGLTISGSLDLTSTSTYGVVLTPVENSSIEASGVITIDQNAICLVALTPGRYEETQVFTILEGGSITGNFGQIKLPSGYFLNNYIHYTPTTVTLSVEEKSILPLATGQNAVNTATALDNVITYNRDTIVFTISPEGLVGNPPPLLQDVFSSLITFTTTEEMTFALNQIQPAQIKGMTITQENNIVQVRNTLSRRIQDELDLEDCTNRNDPSTRTERSLCKRERYDYTIWEQLIGQTFYQKTEQTTLGPLTGYNTNTLGYVLGADRRLGKNFFAGVLGGYSYSHVHWEEQQGTANINSGYGGLYLAGLSKNIYGNLSLTGSWSDYGLHRNIVYPGTDETAKSHHGGSQLLSHFDVGLNLDFYGLAMRPFESFDYISQGENAYTEEKAGEWDLSIKKKNSIMMRNELGLEFSQCFCLKNSKWTIAPKISWVREVRVKGESLSVNFRYADSPFKVTGYFPDRSLVAPGIMVSGLMLDDRLSVALYYDAELMGGYSSHSYGGQARVAF